MNSNYCFMAFGKSQASTESVVIKRYVGIAPVTILAVNPNKAKLEEIYGTTLDKEPEYLGSVENNGTNYPSVRIDFIVKTVGEIDLTTKVTFFLRKQYRFNRDETKVQVMDKYGRTAWATKDQCKNHEIPMNSNGPAQIDPDYRPCYVGEEDFTKFVKTFLNIPDVMKYNKVTNSWHMIENPADAETRFDNIDKLFTGDFSELNGAIAMQPTNQVKALFGVRTTDDNKQYQTVYTQKFLRNNITNYSKLEEDLNSRKAAGAYPNTEFEICDLKEYVVKPTNFESSASSSDLPW